MDLESLLSAVAIQELVDSMKELRKTEKGSNVTIHFTYEEVEYYRKAHTVIICPRSQEFAALLNEDDMDIGRHRWEIGDWNPLIIDKMLPYLYELDYHVDSGDGFAPELLTHGELCTIAEGHGIRGLKVIAAEKFKRALSLFNIYGSAVGFTIAYFKDLVMAIGDVWDLSMEFVCIKALRSWISIHLRENIQEWAKKKQGSKPRFLESTYRLIFRETEQENPDFTALMEIVREKYLKYLDTEIGNEEV